MITNIKRGAIVVYDDLCDRSSTTLRVSFGLCVGAFIFALVVLKVAGV